MLQKLLRRCSTVVAVKGADGLAKWLELPAITDAYGAGNVAAVRMLVRGSSRKAIEL